jgi:hypothetical protein
LLLRKYPDEPNRPDQAYTTRRERNRVEHEYNCGR